ncbi:fungal-specific transcription factor domain-containing protein [Aspergillus spinulosporus]
MEEDNGPDSSGSPDQTPRGPEAGHACNSCRRRKLRCSREVPACQHCRKSASECFYETKRAKPGMKAGALDNIHRRLDALERSLEKHQARLASSAGAEPDQPSNSTIHAVLSTLAAGFQKLEQSGSLGAGSSSKKRRRDENEVHCIAPSAEIPPLPGDEILSHVLEAYFIYIHPWTPIIHEGRLRRRLLDDCDRARLHLVIQSMILVTRPYIEDTETASHMATLVNDSGNTRDWLVSQAMKQPSVENLQTLVIIASNDIGSGRAFRAWPLVGSLSRMVEYLQLTVEHDEAFQHPFCQPYRVLPPPADWTEAEERRRIFWAIFALDRFCSVSMGWNTSLTADDVRRRLPCDGITWRKENPVVTPYFGIWDKSAGRIGNPIAFLPTHPTPAPARAAEDEADAPSEAGTSPGAASSAVDMSTVGAYAYCIEATESLSRVTTYFLQQKVNLNDQKEFGAWLTRFKELDLRLVHWKMLLPQKWTVNVAQQGSTRMDPNLTLAHVTHNASMILLHQPIAFPLPEWPFKSRLPSLCSMDTCQTAAVEVASITNHYLKSSLPMSPLSSQFAFCVFIAARALLLSWKHSPRQESVAPEFWVLVQSLDAMATRWAGVHAGAGGRPSNLPARYSSTLAGLHRRCAHDESFSLDIARYTTEISHTDEMVQLSPGRLPPTSQTTSDSPLLPTQRVSSGHQPTLATQALSKHITACPREPRGGPDSILGQQAFSTPRVPSITPNAFSLNMDVPAADNDIPTIFRADLAADTENSMAMSQMLLDQHFTGLDRVISYNEGLFGSDFEGRRW